MNKRILEIRKSAEMTQEQFAQKMGISKNYVNLIENGKKQPGDRLISDICMEFDVNENWLRTGTGKKRKEIDPDDRYSVNLGKLQRTDDETIIKWVNTIAETDPKKLRDIEAFMKKLLDIT